jgi:AcrR family transcriptional regulator
MTDTKQKIMDAAEKLFAELSVEGASLRAITDAAGVNLGSVYYYFKNKEQLVQEVLQRRLDQFNQEGEAQIASIMKYQRTPSIRDIWLIMIGTLLDFRAKHKDYLKFIQHMQLAKPRMITDAITRKTDDYVENMLILISNTMDEKVREAGLLRCRLLMNMIFHSLLNYDIMQMALKKEGIILDDKGMARHLADLSVASLQEYLDD